MPDLLGATNPVPGYDNTNVNRNIPISPSNNQVQNVPDLDRVTGADHRTEQQDAGQTGEKIRYDSNFQNFIQQLRRSQGAGQALAKLIFREGTVVTSGMSEGIADEMSQVMELLKMDQAQLLDFLSGQMKAGTRFGGALFAMLRNAYARADSEGVRGDILQFLKSYSDWSSTGHIEGNLLRNLAGMANSMPASWGDKLRELLAQLENGVAAGDRQGNISLLQQKVFPLMSSYVGQTHDMGTPRELLSLLALDVARYENGSEEKMLETFHQLSGYGTLKGMLGGVDDKSLLKLLQSSLPPQGAGSGEAPYSSPTTWPPPPPAPCGGRGAPRCRRCSETWCPPCSSTRACTCPWHISSSPWSWTGRCCSPSCGWTPTRRRRRGTRGRARSA